MKRSESAICIRAVDYSETSQVVTFLTGAGGTVRLLAKGTKRAKSKSGGAIDLLSEGELVFIDQGGETMGTLVEFAETVSHSALRRNAGSLNAALCMAEVAGELVAPGEASPEAFRLLHNAFARLDNSAPPAAVLAYFHWRLLQHAGLLGELRNCVSCGSVVAGKTWRATEAAETYFSSAQGGLLCRACEGSAAEKLRLDGATFAGLAALSAAQGGTRVRLSEKQAQAVNRLLIYHIAHQLGKTPRMAKYVLGNSPATEKRNATKGRLR